MGFDSKDFDLAKLPIEHKLQLLSLAAARKRTGVLNPGSQVELEARKQWLAKCKTDLESFTVEAQRHEKFKPARHHKLLLEHLCRVASGELKRLMITMPPGSAKSRYASQLFPAWLLEQRSRLRIIGASHTTSLALDFSDRIQQYIVDNEEVLSYKLKTENKQHWRTTKGGEYLAAGVRSAIPGYRADVVIIDDPVKGRDAADSPVDRKHVWDWYVGSLQRRLTPGGAIILILTRWHEDDLAGRLLSIEPDKWTCLSLPAQAEENDMLGRAPGEWLWADDAYGYGADLPGIKEGLELAGALREWTAQYQQRPRPAEGSIFKIDMLGEKLPVAPAGEAVRAWDLAATKDIGTRDPSWTRGVKLIKTSLGRYVVADVKSIRGTPEEVERLILNTAAQDGKHCRIGFPNDPGQAGNFQVAYYAKKLAGYIFEASPESGEKATRASPFAAQVNIGNVDLVEGPWNAAYIDELGAFPSGAHNDQVDASSRAFSMLIESGAPLVLSEEIRTRLAQVGRMGGRNRFARAYR